MYEDRQLKILKDNHLVIRKQNVTFSHYSIGPNGVRVHADSKAVVPMLFLFCVAL